MDPLDRIAAALERLSPPPLPAADARAHPAYRWQDGVLSVARGLDALPLDRLVGIDRQKEALLVNLRRLAAGHAAQDVLLWGARGTGKSALVRSAVTAVQADGGDLALVSVLDLASLPALFALLGDVGRGFVLFVDDLGVDAPGEGRALRSVLDGGAEPRPANIRLAVTANRRHLQPRDIAEQESAINPRDAADDHLALADRFGLSLGFHNVDQGNYLAIVSSYTDTHGLPFDPDDALRWASTRGNRSGRVAWQYVIDLAGREGRAL